MPLHRRDGSFFGTLCALDPNPVVLTDDRFAMFALLADLIGFQLDAQDTHLRTARALAAARETALLRERFIGILGHDLRNPLGAIALGAQTLLRTPDLPAGPTALARRIASAADRIRHIVDDLVDFARGRLGGGMTLAPSDVDAAALVRQVVDELGIVHAARQIELSGPESVRARWDGTRMAQVFSNLVGNALVHSPPHTTVGVTLVSSGEEVVFTTTNGGAPIPDVVLPRIFDPFRRGGGEVAPGARGVGLGLYIANEIVLAHGGTIEVRSSEDEGTVFTVRLPGVAVGVLPAS